jgi:hypothetical protein
MLSSCFSSTYSAWQVGSRRATGLEPRAHRGRWRTQGSVGGQRNTARVTCVGRHRRSTRRVRDASSVPEARLLTDSPPPRARALAMAGEARAALRCAVVVSCEHGPVSGPSVGAAAWRPRVSGPAGAPRGIPTSALWRAAPVVPSQLRRIANFPRRPTMHTGKSHRLLARRIPLLGGSLLGLRRPEQRLVLLVDGDAVAVGIGHREGTSEGPSKGSRRIGTPACLTRSYSACASAARHHGAIDVPSGLGAG